MEFIQIKLAVLLERLFCAARLERKSFFFVAGKALAKKRLGAEGGKAALKI